MDLASSDSVLLLNARTMMSNGWFADDVSVCVVVHW